MKTSVRNTKFTMGIALFLIIILLLSVLSAVYLNKLSKKTSAIRKENHYSIVYAQDMTEYLTSINQEIVKSFLNSENPDTLSINTKFNSFQKSLDLEKNNITEIGEDVLAANVETGFNDYRDSVTKYIISPKEVATVINLQTKYTGLFHQLSLLSQINEKAIEEKTDEAKVSAKNFSIQMSFIGALCFLISYAFTFSFSSYFNGRFFRFYNGIKEIASNNYNNKLYFDGKDELYDISLIFNEMVDKINEPGKKTDPTLLTDKGYNIEDIQELKDVLTRLKSIEMRSEALISKLEKDGLSG